MSDEEDCGAVLKVKSPHWRSNHLTELVKVLDDRHEEKMRSEGKHVLRKRRVMADSPMERKPTKKLKPSVIASDDESD